MSDLAPARQDGLGNRSPQRRDLGLLAVVLTIILAGAATMLAFVLGRLPVPGFP